MKEKTHNVGHILALALVCCVAWQNSYLRMEEHLLRNENKTLQKQNASTATKLGQLENLASDLLNLGTKIDQQNFSSSQYVLAYSNIKVKAPLSAQELLGDDLHDDEEGNACVNEPWFVDGQSFAVGRRLAKIEKRLHDLTKTLAQVNTNLAERKVALDSVPTILPVDGEINSPFGVRMHPRKKVYRLHRGVDITAPFGSPVRAAAYGVVESATSNRSYGMLITISHGNGIHTKYAHNSRMLVKKGDVVAKGQEIAKVGRSGFTTGAHCHYEVLLDRTPVNPELFVIDKTKMPDRHSPKQVYVEGSDLLGIRKNSLLNRSL